MGDINEPQCDPLASTAKDEPQPSSRPTKEQSKSETTAPFCNNVYTSAAAADHSRAATPEQWYAPGSASLPAYVEQALLEEGSHPLAYSRASSPLNARTTEATDDAQPDDVPTSIAFADPLWKTGDDTVKLDKGKGRARSRSESAEPMPLSALPEDGQHYQATPGVVLNTPSGTNTILQAPAAASTQQSVPALKRPKQIYSVNPGSDDYPHVISPRTINRRGALPYQPRHSLPHPRGMHNYRHVTSYAGEPLFRLCESVPYVLGPRALVTRLQLIVETPIFLPDEVRMLLAANNIDAASLDSYDTAMLQILCCLWND